MPFENESLAKLHAANGWTGGNLCISGIALGMLEYCGNPPVTVEGSYIELS